MIGKLVTVALLTVVGASLAAGPVQAQRDRSGESGIWIADGSGELRRVEPATSTFLTRGRPGTPSSRETEVVLAVETFGRTAAGAMSAGDLAVSRVIGAAVDMGVAAGAIRKEAPVVRPLYQRPGILTAVWEKPRLEGYISAQVLTLRTSDPERLGLLLDLSHGAGATRVLWLGPERSSGW